MYFPFVHCNIGAGMKPANIVVKQYGNRRLYDTVGSRYVNLDDIAGFVRHG
jgi:polyhydroxyalkanoate synthesis regulator protein